MTGGVLVKGLLITGGLLLIGKRLMAMERTAKGIDVLVTPRFKRFTVTEGVVLEIDVEIKNPYPGQVILKQPYVRVLLGDALLGSSQVDSTDFHLAAFEPLKLKPLEVKLTPMGWVAAGLELAQHIKSKKPVDLSVETLTNVRIAGQYVPVRDEMKFQLKF
jgi:hypothetical protein